MLSQPFRTTSTHFEAIARISHSNRSLIPCDSHDYRTRSFRRLQKRTHESPEGTLTKLLAAPDILATSTLLLAAHLHSPLGVFLTAEIVPH